MENLTWIRIGFFASSLTIFALLEWFIPRRKLNYSKLARWRVNLGVIVINNLLLYLLVPVTGYLWAEQIAEWNFGLLNLVQLPLVLELILTIAILDLAIYYQHYLFHKISVLWRLHRMHHADLDLDVSSGLRFHPLEILISQIFKLALIAILGIDAWLFVIFEIILNTTSLFNHSNLYLPQGFDRFLRKIIVTPDFHRLHHSAWWRETDSNFGFNLPWWDYLFQTYKAVPKKGQLKMQIGLKKYQDATKQNLWWALKMPFLKSHSNHND
jgi:sterol desaturase/sphingolipid hydroxylase (fatty acid hydroxylase superfamily)